MRGVFPPEADQTFRKKLEFIDSCDAGASENTWSHIYGDHGQRFQAQKSVFLEKEYRSPRVRGSGLGCGLGVSLVVTHHKGRRAARRVCCCPVAQTRRNLRTTRFIDKYSLGLGSPRATPRPWGRYRVTLYSIDPSGRSGPHRCRRREPVVPGLGAEGWPHMGP